MRRNGFASLVLSVTLLVVSGSSAMAGPITFLTALPVAEGQVILRGQYLLIQRGDDPTAANRDLTVQAVPLAVAFGVSSRLAIFGVVPFLDKTIDVDTPVGRLTRGTSGVGDTLIFARYTVFAHDRRGSTFRLAPFAGAELPTGGTDDSDGIGRLPRPLQLGSGSWDGLAGIAATWQTLDWELDAAASYQRNAKADRFRFGDAAAADVSFQYRLWPRPLGGGVPGFLYGVVESNLLRRGTDELEGVDDRNSGGTTWDLDVGLQFVGARYVLEGIVQIPTVERLNGTALETGYRVSVGLRWNVSLPF